MTRNKHTVKILQHSRPSQQIRVIRVSRPSIKHPKDGGNFRISSVDSWLSSAPSIEQTKIQQPRKTFIIQPFTTKPKQEDQTFRRTCLVISAVIVVIILIVSIVGIVLAVKLQPTTTASTLGTSTINSL